MAYTHSPEIREKMSRNSRGIPRMRKNSKYRDLQNTGFYNAWCSMKSRCLNPNEASYPRYGGRGIKVCEEWMSFENFYKDMYTMWLFCKCIRPQTTLDRIDVNGNYCKENCRWASKKQQANNRRNHKMVKYNGKTMNLTQWAEELGIKKSTLAQRVYTYKWPIERALSA